MLVAGLTGGIGSGKTTFAALLAERGARIIDADQLGRGALKTGEPAWRAVVDEFGDEILTPSMEVDRKRLAEIVFNDKVRLAALNSIVHPVILKGIADELDRFRTTDEIVVLDAALIVEFGLTDILDLIVVVTAPERARRDRLSEQRGMTHEEITARMGAQASEQDLVAKAGIIVTNDGSLDALTSEADRVWAELERRRRAS